MWYHDHALGITRLNVYAGLAGFYLLLNGSDSRFYVLTLDNGMPLLQVGGDQANADIILHNVGPDDPFKGFDANGVAIGGAADPATTGQVMLFRVNQAFDFGVDEASVSVGTSLRPPLPVPAQNGATRQVVLFEGLDDFGRLQPLLGTLAEGSLAWFEPITENPALNDVEVREIYNTTEDAHPIHIHLIAFQIINRESFTGTVNQREQLQHNGTFGVGGDLLASSIVLGGDARPAEPNERGWKDTVVALPGEVTRVITSPFDRSGRYVWHCHILSHEDHEMMRPYHVG